MNVIIKKTGILLATVIVMFMAAVLIVVVHVAKFFRKVLYCRGC